MVPSLPTGGWAAGLSLSLPWAASFCWSWAGSTWRVAPALPEPAAPAVPEAGPTGSGISVPRPAAPAAGSGDVGGGAPWARAGEAQVATHVSGNIAAKKTGTARRKAIAAGF